MAVQQEHGAGVFYPIILGSIGVIFGLLAIGLALAPMPVVLWLGPSWYGGTMSVLFVASIIGACACYQVMTGAK